MGGIIADVSQFPTLSPSSSSFVQIGTLPEFLDQWRSVSFSRFVPNMKKVIIFILGVRFCYFIISGNLTKATPSHYPIIQKWVDELLAKDAIETSTIGTGFYFQHICCS